MYSCRPDIYILWMIYQRMRITDRLSFLTFLQQLTHISLYQSKLYNRKFCSVLHFIANFFTAEMNERNVRVSVKLSPLQPENI